MRRFALAACMVSAAGCSIDSPGGAAGTLPSGRSIVATSDRPFRTVMVKSLDGDTESIQMGTVSPGKILVEPMSIEVDGDPVAEIPETTKSVEVAEDDGRLKITADGATVYDAEF